MKKTININKLAKSKDTKLEMLVRKELWKLGLRYRKNYSELLGSPDIAFPNLKLVIFIDSCFWHGCPLHYKSPQKNRTYWDNKIKRNQERDSIQTEHYICAGWKILRFWEHDIKSNFQEVISEIVQVHKNLNNVKESHKKNKNHKAESLQEDC